MLKRRNDWLCMYFAGILQLYVVVMPNSSDRYHINTRSGSKIEGIVNRTKTNMKETSTWLLAKERVLPIPIPLDSARARGQHRWTPC